MSAATMLARLLLLVLASSPTAGGTGKRGALTPAEKFVAGGIARSVSQMVLYPADAMKTLAQTRDGKTIADVGMRTLVSGCVTTSAFALIVGGIQFAIVGCAAPRLGMLCASALGAIGSSAASVPQEVIKQRLVTGIYPSFSAAVRTIYSAEGIAGFYAGALPTIARNLPFVVTCFCSFEALQRRQLRGRPAGSRLGLGENLRTGIAAALIAVAITQPIDVVKTRMMTQAASGATPYASAIDCVRTIAAAEGLPTFYAGLLQRSAYMAPLWALQFAINGAISEAILARRRSLASEKQA